jgi:hypothetical protein
MDREIRPSVWMPDVDRVEVQLVAGNHAPPVLLEGTPEVEWADAGFASVLAASRRLADLLATLEAAGARYCVFGGWLRDTLAAHAYDTLGPRDVDLVAADIGIEALIAALPTDIRPTMFGGVQSSAEPVPFDIWPLHETFLIRRLSMPVSFGSLLQTADFNINAALYFPAQAGLASAILDAGMLNAIRRRCISFNASHLPFPVMQCSRLIAYGVKLNLDFDAAVIAFMREILRNSTNQAQIIEGLRRYQPRVADKAIAAIRPIVGGGH